MLFSNWVIWIMMLLLCHKDAAQGTQSQLLGAFLVISLVHYGRRAPLLDPFRACMEATLQETTNQRKTSLALDQ